MDAEAQSMVQVLLKTVDVCLIWTVITKRHASVLTSAAALVRNSLQIGGCLKVPGIKTLLMSMVIDIIHKP
jgi:hypothetical protein